MKETRRSNIEYTGIVKEVLSTKIIVQINNVKSCHDCSMKSGCSMSSNDDKITEIKTNKKYNIHDHIVIELNKNRGGLAVLWGFVFPVLFILLMLTTASLFNFSDAVAGLSSLLTLIMYFGGLYFFKEKLSAKFEFIIKE